MFKREEETGKKILVIDQKGKELELTEFLELEDEQGYEIEGRPILRTPGGLRAAPVRGEEGKFLLEGSKEVLTQVKVTSPE